MRTTLQYFIGIFYVRYFRLAGSGACRIRRSLLRLLAYVPKFVELQLRYRAFEARCLGTIVHDWIIRPPH